MIDAESGIEVCVKPSEDGAPFKEYIAPATSPLYTGRRNEAYIEAVTDQRFGIFIRLGPGFDFKGCSRVRVRYSIDKTFCFCRTFLKPARKQSRDKWAFSHREVPAGEGASRYFGYTFGEVVPAETMELTQDQEDKETKARGRIRVTVCRGSAVYRPYDREFESTTSEMVLQSSKKVAVDNGKSHSLKPLDLGPAVIPNEEWFFTPASGTKGQKMDFTFLYTSRMILELKKIAPTDTGLPNLSKRPQPLLNTPRASLAPKRKAIEPASKTGISIRQDDEIMIVDPPTTTLPKIKQEQKSIIDITSDEPVAKKVKTKHDQAAIASTAAVLPGGTAQDAAPGGQSGTARATARINLELEENRLKREEIELKRRLMELDDGDRVPEEDTEHFFSRLLLASHYHETSPQWWQSATPDSPLGILADVHDRESGVGEGRSRVTEVLFYASKDIQSAEKSPTPTIPSFSVHALLLSSDRLVQAGEPTPPGSPIPNENGVEGVFLPLRTSATTEMINEPPVRKRKSVNDTFDEAAERRKKARRKGGEGVAAAAAIKTEDSIPSLKHRRTVSISDGQAIPLQASRLSRSPSVASSRPTTAGAPLEAAKRSSLSRVQSISGPSSEGSLEDKNKAIISRVVMAGMRLYGLTQSKSRKSRASSATLVPLLQGCPEPSDADQQRDEEYKLVYHQTFKGTCFAYRENMAGSSLQPLTEALRDTVDRLLDMFCNDPLKAGLPGIADKLTPGGRKAFGAGKTSESDGIIVSTAG
ncbi:hypothetical protein B0A55_05784 [Friedmanniomyces simplex]|uniref:Uncharacterized protein n=1 Tax=Friedmanniomyces simplex TaxID=329884 RepID=A0A4U0XGQ8_9PEZI|nr:hypothetical protein B0A55_05784 [Friedmanniomyces simplex]